MKPHAAAHLPLLLWVAACSSTPPLRTYVLTPPRQATAVVPIPASPSEQLVISRVRVPDYLDTTDILFRDGTNKVKTSTTGRWGERLSHGLTEALTADLEARLPTDQVVADMSSSAQRQVLINVDALDLWPNGRCVMAATWAILDNVEPRTIVYGGATFDSSPPGSMTPAGDAGLVDAISHTVGKLADAIALTIRQGSVQPAPRSE